MFMANSGNVDNWKHVLLFTPALLPGPPSELRTASKQTPFKFSTPKQSQSWNRVKRGNNRKIEADYSMQEPMYVPTWHAETGSSRRYTDFCIKIYSVIHGAMLEIAMMLTDLHGSVCSLIPCTENLALSISDFSHSHFVSTCPSFTPGLRILGHGHDHYEARCVNLQSFQGYSSEPQNMHVSALFYLICHEGQARTARQ